MVGKIERNVYNRKNQDGALRHEANDYLCCFVEVNRAQLKEVFDEDSERWASYLKQIQEE